MLQNSTTQDFWPKLQESLKNRFGEEIFQMWFEALVCLEGEEDQLIIGVPNEFSQIWIQDNYLEFIQKEVSIHAPRAMGVCLQVVAESFATPSSEPELPIAAPRATFPGLGKDSGQRKRTATRSLNPSNTFSNFVVGNNSQFAHAACIAVATSPGTAYNPLFLYGDNGLGKTHLMHAVAHWINEKSPEANIQYISCEHFTNEYIKAIQENSTDKFRKRYRNVDVLLIDDIHFLAGKNRIQEEFFYTFNELFENQKQIILTSDRPASEIDKLENRLVSRFQMGLVTDIQQPDLETRMAILQKKARAMKFNLPDDIMQFIAQRVSRNVRLLEGSLVRVGSYASLMGRDIDLPTVIQLLGGILQEQAQNQITLEKIQQKVVGYYNLRQSDMTGKQKPNHIAFPRQVAMFLCRKLTKHSLKEIGEVFGGRHHGTVMHACKTVQDIMNQDPHYKREVEYLITQITKESEQT